MDTTLPSFAQNTALAAQRPAAEEWTISEMAQAFDTTPRALRFYEDKGLLSPRRVGANRMFGARDRVRLDQIQRGKRMGFSLDDIRDVLEIYEGKVLDRLELLRRKKGFESILTQLSTKRADIEIIAQNLADLCRRIDSFVADPARDAATFTHARAYEAVLSRSLDDDFSGEDRPYPRTQTFAAAPLKAAREPHF